MITRRVFLSSAASVTLLPAAAGVKPLRGIFPIVATPFTESKAVDYEDLDREVAFFERSRVQGIVWPQLASEYMTLSKEERIKGMTTLARAAQGKAPALVFGVQGENINQAMEYLRHAESLAPDALIAIPPSQAKSVDDYRRYYATLAAATNRPFFIQTTGGAKDIIPPVEMIAALAKEFPHLAYVKEEANPVIERMLALKKHAAVRSVFSGNAGKGMLYEFRLGMDGTMPGAPYADIYARIWEAWQSGDQALARRIFANLLLMINLDQVLPGTRQYILKKRGIFKTTVSRRQQFHLSPKAIEEIDFCFTALRPWLHA
jgi:4-hydroxy-tetrahydrodipicolinate synthase